MGPRLCSRGDNGWTTAYADSPPQLQWGRGFVAAETRRIEGNTFRNGKLQWGRGFVAAETSRRGRGVQAGVWGFNGAAAL